MMTKPPRIQANHFLPHCTTNWSTRDLLRVCLFVDSVLPHLWYSLSPFLFRGLAPQVKGQPPYLADSDGSQSIIVTHYLPLSDQRPYLPHPLRESAGGTERKQWTHGQSCHISMKITSFPKPKGLALTRMKEIQIGRSWTLASVSKLLCKSEGQEIVN